MIEVQNNITETKPLNSDSESFRAELAKLQEQSTEGVENTENIESNVVENQEVPTEEVKTQDEDYENEGNVQGMVPRGRLNKVLEKRKELEVQAQADRDARIKAETELDMLRRAMEHATNIGQDKNNAEAAFEPLDQDAHNIYMQELKTTRAEMRQMQMRNTLELQEAKFTQAHPDFREAYDYLLNASAEVNKHVCASDMEAQAMTIHNMREIATRALNQNKDAAEVFYTMAKKFGYSAKAQNTNSGPNINAINNNMKKSTIADVNQAPLQPSNGASNYTKMDNFSKAYDGSADSFRKILNAIKTRN